MADISAGIAIPYPIINAPVIHSGKYHVLTAGQTSVVLDGTKGMSLAMVIHGFNRSRELDPSRSILHTCRLEVITLCGADTMFLSQNFDPAARVEVIDQGPGRIAARTYFSLYSPDGTPHGSGSMDIIVYDDRIHLVPSIYVDYDKPGQVITSAGFTAGVSGERSEMIYRGESLISRGGERFLSFGPDSTGFNVMVSLMGRSSFKAGWTRNRFPDWLYMRNTASNPETDELYEKWPPWITQRGVPLTWTPAKSAGLLVEYADDHVENLSFRWINSDSLQVPEGGYTFFNGIIGLFMGDTVQEAELCWDNHNKPSKPSVRQGIFKYYNEIEGVYEIDSAGKDVDITVENMTGIVEKHVFLRIWNLSGKGGYEVKVNGAPVPFGLYNDGDIIEDPMVSVEKTASGPARFTGIPVNVQKGTRAKVTLSRKPGMQFSYQMYSKLGTYEAWSDCCGDKPLFKFHTELGTMYEVNLPGKTDYAIFKLPLFWLKNGVNNDTFMNHTRTMNVSENGPGQIAFTYSSVNLLGTGLSTYTVKVPKQQNRIQVDITAEFTPLDDGKRWTSIEYCDLYPFDNVYRRTFHYRDVIFLTSKGVFDRIGTGAWNGRFETVEEPQRLSYHAIYVNREGSGSRTPESGDGTVWILGNNSDHGNVLYRRGTWTPSPGASSVFSLCNAWVDIHNTVVNRTVPTSKETISYAVEVFPGSVPPIETLNGLYAKTSGGMVKQVRKVIFDESGVITGFEQE